MGFFTREFMEFQPQRCTFLYGQSISLSDTSRSLKRRKGYIAPLENMVSMQAWIEFP